MSSVRRWLWLIISIGIVALLVTACGGTAHHAPPKKSVSTLSFKRYGGHSYGGSIHPPGWGTLPPNSARSLRQLHKPIKGVQTFEMYDTIDVNTVYAATNNPFAVAGYTAGYWPTYLQLVHAFPSAHVISINIGAYGYHGDCLDIEPGDADASQAATWVGADMLAGFPHPCVYTSISNLSNVETNLYNAGFHYGQYFTWCAWYRFIPGLVQGCDAVQWTDSSHNANLDESTVTAGFLSIAQPPYNPAPPPPTNLMHYEYYDSTAVSNPWHQTNLSEYRMVFNYDWYRAYPIAYAKQLSNLEVKLTWWAQQLAWRIHHSTSTVNNANRRNARYGNDVARALHHKRCFSFTGCEYGIVRSKTNSINSLRRK